MFDETEGKCDGTEGNVLCLMEQREKCDVWWNRGKELL